MISLDDYRLPTPSERLRAIAQLVAGGLAGDDARAEDALHAVASALSDLAVREDES